MKKWWRRIRAAIGMGLTWAAAWFGAGILLARVPGFYSDLPFALLFAPLGFVTGIIFSGILVGIERRRRFDRVSLSRFAVWGALSGLLLSGIFVVGAALRGASSWGEFLVFGPPLAIASAVCAAGSLAIARRAERGELGDPSGDPAEAELTGDKNGELLGRGD
jgi:predicted Kef-type K+ transport protein